MRTRGNPTDGATRKTPWRLGFCWLTFLLTTTSTTGNSIHDATTTIANLQQQHQNSYNNNNNNLPNDRNDIDQMQQRQSRHLQASNADILIDRDGNSRAVNMNATNPFRIFSEEEIEKERRERKQRIRERRERVRELLKNAPPPKQEQLTKLSEDEVNKISDDRKLNWFSGSSTSSYSASFLADPSQDYDKWAQAYRMLGGYIDCDHDKDSSGSHNSGDNNNGGGEAGGACSRWMMWAAVSNPLTAVTNKSMHTSNVDVASLLAYSFFKI